MTRKQAAQQFLLLTLVMTGVSPASLAFEGGVGGLGKTKPETGVVLLDQPDYKNGLVSAEISFSNDRVARVEFASPWPLLPTTSGLEARSLQQPESAYVQVIDTSSKKASLDNVKQIKALIVDNIFGSQGKFGAYGPPTDIKVTQMEQDLYVATFTALTPSMLESPRKLFVKIQQTFSDNLILLVTGTTMQRFSSQQTALKTVADSFVSIQAPPRKTKEKPSIGEDFL